MKDSSDCIFHPYTCRHAFVFYQVSQKGSVELLADDKEQAVTQIAHKLGLVKVGWIFTDLVAKDLQSGTVKHFRGNVVRTSALF